MRKQGTRLVRVERCSPRIHILSILCRTKCLSTLRMDRRYRGAMLASIQIAEHKARAAATFRRPTKEFEVGINVMHLNYLLAFDGVIASRGGIPLIEQGAIIGAIGCSGGADSQDEIVSNAGAALINQPAAGNK